MTAESKLRFGDEQVFVIPSSFFSELNDGFTKEKHCKKIYTKYDNIGKFIYRYDAEGNSTFLQLIPYVIIYSPKLDKYYVYTRKEGSGEQRLHSQKSIGFGGHINPVDGPNMTVKNGMMRELEEELVYSSEVEPFFIGYTRNANSNLNDHIGLIFELHVDEAQIRQEESCKYEGEWFSKEELEHNYLKFESWGKFIISHIVDGE